MMRQPWKMHSINTQLPCHIDTTNSRQLLLKSTQKAQIDMTDFTNLWKKQKWLQNTKFCIEVAWCDYLLTKSWYHIISDEIWVPLSAHIVGTIKSALCLVFSYVQVEKKHMLGPGPECSSTSQITLWMKILSSVRHSWAWGSDETGLAGNRVYQHT